MKKFLLVFIIMLGLLFSGCNKDIHEYYNEKDIQDFGDQYGSTIKFKICDLKQVIDVETIKKSNLSGGLFLFIGGVSSNSTEETKNCFNYYTWLETSNGATYFFVIPSQNVAIYQDAPEGEGWVVGFSTKTDGTNDSYLLNARYRNIVSLYNMFNFHIPKGTIIANKIENISIDKWLKNN